MGILRGLQSIYSELPLRVGLGATFYYSGYTHYTDPSRWKWEIYDLGQLMQGIITSIGIDLFLQVQGLVELAFAFVLFALFLPRRTLTIVSFLAALEMLSILLFIGVRLDTFRDLGLLGAAISLFIFSLKPYGGTIS